LTTTREKPVPAYANIQNFQNLVRAANPTFERRKASSLRPLITILESATGTANQVDQALSALAANKVGRYLDALYYLLATYPGLPANAATHLNIGALQKTNAVRYALTPMPHNFTPTGPQAGRVFVTPASGFLNQTVEQFILCNHANTGVLLIHLSGTQAGMDLVFNGRTVLKHMNSVLRVARLKGCQLCVLTMNASSDVCAELRAEYNQYANRVRVYEPHHHMGSIDANFRNFATAHTHVVVMGFDAGVCVFANVFGSDERMPDNSYRAPLATLTNVVMSRATLVSNGNIWSQSATMGAAEYGPLFNT
jgi:hypothetical protein